MQNPMGTPLESTPPCSPALERACDEEVLEWYRICSVRFEHVLISTLEVTGLTA